jgi:predicted 3-demethylubiquinone-9 3-methyltransferase (glyoxalase superfamily)
MACHSGSLKHVGGEMMKSKIQKITPNLWFHTQAEEAAKFYTSIFSNSKIGRVTRYGKERGEEGAVMTVEFQLAGQEFVALNGGPQFNFTEAISFIVNCEDQEELDYFWGKLTEGGDEKAQVCGWLKDKYNVSWQIIPANLSEIISGPDPEKTERVMKALLQTKKKIDIQTLMQAYEG